MQASTNGNDSTTEPQGLPFDAVTGGAQQQLSPEQVQQLVSAYGNGQLAGSGGQPDLSKVAAALGKGGSGGASSTQAPQIPQTQEEAYAQALQSTQQAKLDTNYGFTPRQQRLSPSRRDLDHPELLHRANPYADIPTR